MVQCILNSGWWAAARYITALFILLCSVAQGQTSILQYPLSPDHLSDDKVTAMVNGQPLPLEYFKNFETYYYQGSYARFAADGPVNIELQMHVPIRIAFLRTVLKDIPFTQDGCRFRFTLPRPGHYYVQLPELGQPQRGNENSGTYTILFMIDDLNSLRANRMNPADPDVVDVSKRAVTSDPQKDQTEAIANIIARGGRIYFPPGIYRTGGLRVPSDTTIYFAPGAILKAVDDARAAGERYLDLTEAKNVKISGPGMLDGNNHDLHILNTENSRDLTLQDVLFRNCKSWAIHLLLVEQVVCRNIRILSGKDGIDPDCARDVLIENVLILAKDDAVAVKTRKPPASTERVTVRNSIVASDASALKIGTETRALMRDITFENCDVFDSDRGIILYARDGGPIENVTWRNIRMFMLDWPHETGGAPFQFLITKRGGLTPVRNCVVENITTSVVAPSSFAGLPEAPLYGLKLRNITLKVEEPRNGKSQPYLFNVGDQVEVSVDGLFVDWQGHRDKWSSLCTDKGLKINRLVEIKCWTDWIRLYGPDALQRIPKGHALF